MGGLSVLIIMGILTILGGAFILYNLMTISIIILAIIFGIIYIKKKKYQAASIVFLILSIIFTVIDVSIIYYFIK